MLTYMIIGFLGLCFLGIPIAFAMGWLGLIWIFMTGGEPTLVVRRIYYGLDSFPLLAVPLFILAAGIMNNSEMSRKLVDFGKTIVGRFKGGLAHATIFVSMVFAGISGSSQADTAGVGGVLMPAMKKEGYSDEVSTGLTVAASTIGVIIPPSIPMLIIGATVSISIAGMFLGGIIPGILIGLAQMGVVVLMSSRFKFPPGQKCTFAEFLKAAWRALPALVIPIIVIGGIVGGIFTPTEAGDICVVYAVMTAFLTRQMNMRKLWKTLKEAGILSSIPLIICGFGLSLGWILAYEGIPVQINQTMTSWTTNPTVILFIIAIIVLIAGCFMDNIAIILLLCPVLMPVVETLKIDPIHFGLVVTIGSAIGLITPPVGLCLFVASSLTGVPIEKIFKGSIPFLIAETVIYILVIIYPPLVTWVPYTFLLK